MQETTFDSSHCQKESKRAISIQFNSRFKEEDTCLLGSYFGAPIEEGLKYHLEFNIDFNGVGREWVLFVIFKDTVPSLEKLENPSASKRYGFLFPCFCCMLSSACVHPLPRPPSFGPLFS